MQGTLTTKIPIETFFKKKSLLNFLTLLFFSITFFNPLNAQNCDVEGGKIFAKGPRLICAGDGIDDFVDVSLNGDSGENSAWVITDEDANILALPEGPPFNFEGAGSGVCLIWHLSFSGDLIGAEVGNNASALEGCYDLSNSIRIIRRGVDGGEISTDDPTSICVGDGTPNFVTPKVTGAEGKFNVWVVTDENGNILAFPKKFPIDFEGAGAGICQIWHISYMFGLKGIGLGKNIFDLQGCLDLSNPITINRTESSGPISGGTISTSDATEICVGDGVGDPIDVTLTGNTGQNSAWVITDAEANILALPPGPPFDLEGAGAGVCLIWHLSFEDGLSGAEVGANAADLDGCFSLSNPITVTRSSATGGMISLAGGETEVSICALDGDPDPLDVSLAGNSGDNSAWVITDPNGNILGLPPGPPFDLEGAGAGTCLIWHLSFADGLTGASIGANAADLQGCFSLSNPIIVSRYVAAGDLSGGTISTDSETTTCTGDGSPDFIFVDLEGVAGTNSAWVITDTEANILALPDAPPFNFEDAGEGVCLIWHLSFEPGLLGAEVGANAADLQGCYSLSNPITVTRQGVHGGEISLEDGSTAYTICAGDGTPDPLSVSLTGAEGENSSWVITDEDFNILGLPPGPPFDLEGAGEGVCLIWHASSNGTLEGVEVGGNALEIEGCLSLSNPIVVTRVAAPEELSGGAISTMDPTEICAGDGVEDLIDVMLEGASGTNSGWVITDVDGNILGLPAGPPFDLEGAGTGVCLIWHISFEDGLKGVAVGNNAADLQGCFALSNPITVTRTGVQGGSITLAGGGMDTSICVGDGNEDPFNVVLMDKEGKNSAWVITDANGNILGIPPGPPFNLEGAGTGVCLVWHLSFEDGLEGAIVGNNAADLQGCYSLSNPITVNRTGVNGGTITLVSGGVDTSICVGDGVADPFQVVLSEAEGANSAWVITNEAGEILGIPAGPPFDLEGAGEGVCLVWHLSFEDGLVGAEVGANAADLSGCFSLSNPIAVTRVSSGPECGTILGRKGFSEKMYEVFPNPVTSILNIKMQIESDKEAEISVTNAAGQQVISRDLARLYLGEVIRLDVSGIDKGYYFIKVESASGSEIKPFVVQ